jgi:hypothetical protein
MVYSPECLEDEPILVYPDWKSEEQVQEDAKTFPDVIYFFVNIDTDIDDMAYLGERYYVLSDDFDDRGPVQLVNPELSEDGVCALIRQYPRCIYFISDRNPEEVVGFAKDH